MFVNVHLRLDGSSARRSIQFSAFSSLFSFTEHCSSLFSLFLNALSLQYNLTIRAGHKLVQSGPYTYLLHPSYTATALVACGSLPLLFYRGLWPVMITFTTKYTYQLAQSGIPVLSSLAALSPFALSNYARESPAILGIDVGTWAAVLLVVMHIRMLVRRVDAEEKMLKEHFGREWEVFASTRWRYIPFVC